ncbi:hypothetical protein Scep_009334 [Stephania cephalantha]|uniref:Uncharacterized protein n=1 Tax=Stephania cephalantha TaxID=152367 RepID=A0AAP0JUD8_9MAGN
MARGGTGEMIGERDERQNGWREREARLGGWRDGAVERDGGWRDGWRETRLERRRWRGLREGRGRERLEGRAIERERDMRVVYKWEGGKIFAQQLATGSRR